MTIKAKRATAVFLHLGGAWRPPGPPPQAPTYEAVNIIYHPVGDQSQTITTLMNTLRLGDAGIFRHLIFEQQNYIARFADTHNVWNTPPLSSPGFELVTGQNNIVFASGSRLQVEDTRIWDLTAEADEVLVFHPLHIRFTTDASGTMLGFAGDGGSIQVGSSTTTANPDGSRTVDMTIYLTSAGNYKIFADYFLNVSQAPEGLRSGLWYLDINAKIDIANIPR